MGLNGAIDCHPHPNIAFASYKDLPHKFWKKNKQNEKEISRALKE